MKCNFNEYSNLHYLHLKTDEFIYLILKAHLGIKILRSLRCIIVLPKIFSSENELVYLSV